MSSLESLNLRQRIIECNYDGWAADLVRFSADPHDDVLAPLVREITALEDSPREALMNVDDEPANIVELFAERRTLSALAARSLPRALEALDARLVAYRKKAPDKWRRDLRYTLYVVRQLSGGDDVVLGRAEMIGGRALMNEVSSALDDLQRVDSLEDVGRVPVHTIHGFGVLEMETPTQPGHIGWMHAPSLLKSNRIGFAVTTNVPDTAVRIADAIESDTPYVVYGPRIAVLPDTLIPFDEVAGPTRSSGCLVMNVVENDGDGADVMECYVAELDNADRARGVAEAINDSGGDEPLTTRAYALDVQMVILSVAPSFDDVNWRLAPDLTTFDSLVDASLAGALVDESDGGSDYLSNT